MIGQVIAGPGATLYALGRLSLLVLGLCGIISGSTLGTGITAGYIRNPEVANATLATFCVGAAFLLLLYTSLWWRLEDNFESWPWKLASHASEASDGSGEASSSLIASSSSLATKHALLADCPLTGLRPTMRCPCCNCCVHESAFHYQDKLTTFVVGETVLRWDAASEALKKVANPAQGRIFLDEALDLRGNYFLGCVGNCCVGCATWQRCFNLIPRWCLTLECLAIVAAYVPWAFKRSLETVSWGAGVQSFAEAYAVFNGISALVLQLHAICQSLAFTMAHEDNISFPYPAPRSKAVRAVIRFFA